MLGGANTGVIPGERAKRARPGIHSVISEVMEWVPALRAAAQRSGRDDIGFIDLRLNRNSLAVGARRGEE
jgi:hypothetical protein